MFFYFYRAAQIACVTKVSFIRFFSYICGMTLTSYIRCRRLTLAAYELRNSDIKVIDVAMKYGFRNIDTFTRAFTKQHGITPTQARNPYQSLRIYPPVSFHIRKRQKCNLHSQYHDQSEYSSERTAETRRPCTCFLYGTQCGHASAGTAYPAWSHF